MKYFDHAASTSIYPEVLDSMIRTFKEDFANPNSRHLFGSALLKKIDDVRVFFLQTLKADKHDLFIFTSSATESNNTVIKGMIFNEGDTILYSKADHASMVEPIEAIAIEKKLKLKIIPLDKRGLIDIEEFKNLLSQDVKLVAITHVNNQSGVINDIHLLAGLVKEYTAAHVHVDAVQSFTKISFNVSGNIDSSSMTSHKIGGPKGVAGLFLKQNHKIKPLLMGGGQEYGLRSSTQAFPLIKAFADAARISLNKMDESFINALNLNETVKTFLSTHIPAAKFPFVNTSPYILTFILPGIPSDVLLRRLEQRSFILSSTAACSSKIKGFNPTLASLNISETFHKNVLRLSFGHDTSKESVDLLNTAFLEVWNDLKFLTK
ncbi:MAG: aminotransferase class V-fold PLP-dependent enzyme [Bacteriovorax sp.]